MLNFDEQRFLRIQSGAVALAERLDETIGACLRAGAENLTDKQLDRLTTAIDANPGDLRARHLLGAHAIVEGNPEAGLQQFMEMLRRDRAYEDGLPRKALIDAFRIIDDQDLIGRYRRQISSLLLA